MRKRFLDINVFAGLAGPDCCQRVPMIGQGEHDGVDGFIVKDAAQVCMCCDLFTAIFERLGLPFEERLVDIAQGNDFCPRHLPQPRNELVSSSTHASNGRRRTHSNNRHPD
jgi:hypothetical protein